MSIYQELARMAEAGEQAAVCTVINAQGSTPRHTGSKMIVYPGGKIMGTIGGGEMENRVITSAYEVIASNKPQRLDFNLSDPTQGDPGICGGQMEVFVEPVQPDATIVVIGGGHVGKAVVHLAKWLGYRVILSDDREEFCNAESVPGADEYLNYQMKDMFEYLNIHAQTYLIFTTRNTSIDIEALPVSLESPARYIGVIGSKRRWEVTRKTLIEEGISAEKLDLVDSPMGLDIHAESPQEIAVSILSQVIKTQNEETIN